MTTAVVLAAGIGRRLRQPVPKWLAPVGALHPGAVQLEALESAGIRRVVVVAGPQVDTIERFLEPWRTRLDLELVVNDRHATLNNWYSLLEALRTVDDDVLVLNSDLFAASAWLATTAARLLASGQEAALAIDLIRPLTDEAMKVGIDARRCIERIGKVDVDAAKGEYVGMSWWSAPGARQLRTHLEAYLDLPGAEDNWYEHAIDDHVRAGGRYEATPVPSMEWVEIDDPSDLAQARRLAAGL